MVQILGNPTIVVTVLAALVFAFKVIITGRAILIACRFTAVVDDFLHPPLLGFLSCVDRFVAVLSRMIDALGDVITLHLQDVGEVELKGSLISTHDKKIRITSGMDAE